MSMPNDFRPFTRQFLKVFAPRPKYIKGVGLCIGVAPDDERKQLFLPSPHAMLNAFTFMERIEIIKHIGFQIGIGGRMQSYKYSSQEAEARNSVATLMFFINNIFGNLTNGPSLEYRILMAFNAYQFFKSKFYHVNTDKILHNYEITVSLLYILFMLYIIFNVLSNMMQVHSAGSAIVGESTQSNPIVLLPATMKIISEIVNISVFIVESFFEAIYDNFTSNFSFAEGRYNSVPSMMSVTRYSQQFMFLGDFINSIDIQRRLLDERPILTYGIMNIVNSNGFGFRLPIVAMDKDEVESCLNKYLHIAKEYNSMDMCFDCITNRLLELSKIVGPAPLISGVTLPSSSGTAAMNPFVQWLVSLLLKSDNSQSEFDPTHLPPVYINGRDAKSIVGRPKSIVNSVNGIFTRIQSLLNEINIRNLIFAIIFQDDVALIMSFAKVFKDFSDLNLQSKEDILKYILTGSYVNDKGNVKYSDGVGSIHGDTANFTTLPAENTAKAHVTNPVLSALRTRIIALLTAVITATGDGFTRSNFSQKDVETLSQLRSAKSAPEVSNILNSAYNPDNDKNTSEFIKATLASKEGLKALEQMFD